MSAAGPDYERVAAVLVRIGLRIVNEERREHTDADGGVLPSVDRGAGGGGFSIAGQADKLRVYAELHDLGEVTVIADPGLSGKNLERPGLQQLLHMVDEGHVANVLTWRLDRLSRNLSDLILLADRFGQAGVALHSFTEKIDLSSATGRMFYNILGSFAQFYREQLAENVRMGMQQAVRQGKWVNRPKTGYALVDGELVANEMAPVVRRIFTLRTEGQSIGKIADATGIKYSTVLTILTSRIYLGEVQMNGEWFPGRHEAIITPEQFAAAHRGRVKGRARGTDLMSGRVRCGLCQRLMALDQNGKGQRLYRCHHRGQGCAQPRRTNVGLLRAAVLGLRLIGDDAELQAAIRKELERALRRPPGPAEGPALGVPVTVSRSWCPNAASCCACTTPTRSEPTCSPRKRHACPWPSVRHSVRLTMTASRWRAPTTSHTTSTRSHASSQLSTSTRRGTPRRRSSGASSSTSSSRKFRCYRITST